MNSTLKYIIPAIIILLSLEGCKKLPKYDNTPQIEFAGFEVVRNRFNDLAQVYEDSAVFKINFKDGDGDLGLDENDKKTDTIPNFVMLVYKKNNTPFSVIDTIEGQFQPLTLSAKEIKGPISGELRRFKTFQYSDFAIKDTLKFDIYIKDRAHNQSNTITTPELVVRNN